MNKIIYFIVFCVIFFLSSCSKGGSSQEYCAECIELDSGYISNEFCGTSSQVDAYINEFESYDPQYPNQVWSCDKYYY